MNATGEATLLRRTHELLAGVEGRASTWIGREQAGGFVEPLALIVAGAGAYGAAMGAWRDPLLGLYVAIKLPLLLVATALVDALANGLWARRFGFELGFLQSLRAVLLAFALASIVLGGLAPVVGFFALVLPGHDSSNARLAHDILGVANVVFIALAGTIAVVRQRRWLAETCPELRNSHALVATWLLVNLLAGAQLSWNLRPWFGSPGLDVAFLREHPFDGTFYESFVRMLLHT